MKRAIHITLLIIAVVLSIGLLLVGVGMGRALQPDTVCTVLKYDISDSDKRLYLSENELSSMLRAQDIYPIGKPLSHISTQRIEDVVRSNPMVRTAECFTNPKGELCVSLTQRKPLLKVITADDSYIIDTDRRRMPIRNSITDPMLVVIGRVGERMALTDIADFAEWLYANAYWQQRIKYMEVRTPRYVRLLPIDPQAEIIVLGDLENYADKLRKLKIYYENSTQEVRDKQYKELDLRFKGQVIGRK